MHRLVTLIVSTLFAITVLSVGSLTAPAPVAAATLAATTLCANSVDNTPGLGIICEVTIENVITAVGGSAQVTVRECHGAADAEAECTTQEQTLTEPVTRVEQCNYATDGGGGTLRCSVQITNTFVTDPSPTAVTVNQCVGSGDGDGSGCDPFPATTTGATITQCNDSANGGTLVELTCTASGTQSDALDVTINQCNNSTNGGGGLVICSATIDTVVAAAASPTPTPTPSDTTNVVRPTTPPTDSVVMGPVSSPAPAPVALLFGIFAIFAFGFIARLRTRRS